ncbi:hypothetical protein DICPUDRAFT_92997 [Dictyostelium purpureum]|uniref:KANL3/Tex30 alpha/beta hydrolase-like domain-containing protein n=1 Tax=Dictyostelium purpureum TaxID=5786 RepID=F1A0H5_DICPU|nr:uncharacterized protein DICPUDRAFT_92997 [Dictyostelium purpureum]EGC30318.1 hypothetical protein DICPUDRAFT_92997 [Dictyostelium purpureum]|eukprot:XP_003293169.1 hypothetical protein DICPUDRAFT_92997 [Dictyostelium purpureum]
MIFVHGVGSSRFSPRNLYLSKFFQSLGFSTLLFDIMTPQEERLNNITGEYKYNVNFISKRIISATQFINSNQKLKKLPIILYGSSTGSAGIIESEGKLKSLGININSIVSRSGRLSLCNRNSLGLLNTPILLLCGGDDKETIDINRQSLDSMHYCQSKKLEIIANSSHLFPENGALEKVAKISFNFLNYHLNNPIKY